MRRPPFLVVGLATEGDACVAPTERRAEPPVSHSLGEQNPGSQGDEWHERDCARDRNPCDDRHAPVSLDQLGVAHERRGQRPQRESHHPAPRGPRLLDCAIDTSLLLRGARTAPSCVRMPRPTSLIPVLHVAVTQSLHDPVHLYDAPHKGETDEQSLRHREREAQDEQRGRAIAHGPTGPSRRSAYARGTPVRLVRTACTAPSGAVVCGVCETQSS